MLNKFSIRLVVGSLITVLGIVAFAFSGNLLFGAVKDWRAAQKTSAMTTASRELFETLTSARVERAFFLGALQTDTPAGSESLARIGSNRTAGNRSYEQAVAHLGALDFPGRSAGLERLRAAHAAMEKARTDGDALIREPKAKRDMAGGREFTRAATDYLDGISAVTDSLEMALTGGDTLVDTLLGIKRAAWSARSVGGGIAIRIERAAAAGRGWSPEDIRNNAQDAGRMEQAWAQVKEIGARPSAPEEIRTVIREGDGYFSGPMADERAGLIRTLSAGTPISMPLADLQKRNTFELGVIGKVAITALDQMVKAAAAKHASAIFVFTSCMILMAITVVLWIGGLIVVKRRVSTPLKEMSLVMKRLADHDLTVEIPGTGRGDEIGTMAVAVEVFKENAIQADRLAAEQEAEHQSRIKRAAAIEALTKEFDRKVSGVLAVMTGACTEMDATAQNLSASAEQTSRQSGAVAAATEQASANVQTVASAVEELSSSIAEIGRQLDHAKSVGEQATDEANQTDEMVKGLAETSARIGTVINLINDIAAQTNLLALNATIEAARAGDAGKGFAVVANEVKNLASQTAKATEEISQQIGSVQEATKRVVTAIDAIVARIGEVSQVSATIASAVEEQSAAAAEITRNVQQAAQGTQEISSNIVGVNAAAEETGSASQQVLTASQRLAREAASLKSVVETFLNGVRAA